MMHYLFKIRDKSGSTYVGVTYCYEQDLEDKLLKVTIQNEIDPLSYEAMPFTDETIAIKI